MRRLRTGSGLVLMLGLVSCGDLASPGGSEGGPARNESDGDRAAAPASSSASAAVSALRSQLRVTAPSHADPSAFATGTPVAPAARISAFDEKMAVRFGRVGASLVPTFEDGHRASANVALGARANTAFRIEEPSSGVALSARLSGALPTDAEVSDGYVVYPAAAPGGGAIVHRVIDAGTEDYVSFPQAPAVEEVAYELELSPAVAGLRLVERTLEALDASGTPRLHVAPPFLVGADGRRHDASVEVSGCAVDTSPSAPWGQPVVAPGASHCLVRIAWADSGVVYPAVLDPSWTTAGNLTRARWHATATVLQNGRVLVAGGESTGFVTTQTAELYDPNTRTWAATGSMQVRRRDHRAARLQNDNIMVTGGFDDVTSSVTATVESYNQTSGTWSSLASMVSVRRFHTATVLQSGDVLVTGGITQKPTLAAAEIYNHNTNAWHATTDMQSPQQQHTATLLNNGNVLVVGFNAPEAQIFNPSTSTWTATPAMAAPRLGHAAMILTDGRVLVAGGLGIDRFGNLSSTKVAEIYNPSANTWTRVGSTTYGHADGVTANRLNSGRVVIVGEDTANSPRTIPEVFDPTWGTWTPTPTLNSPHSGHVSARLGSGRILVAGGQDLSGNLVLTSEEFDSTTTATNASEYKLAAAVDADVLSDRATEEWAVVHRPATLTAGTRYPLLIFLHGNHQTCGHGSNPRVDDDITYTTTGTCPNGYVPVPSHRGYDYTAAELASRGYIVVSINANRGINFGAGVSGDSGLNLARGRLILKHLQKISEWDRGVSPTPASLGVSLQNHIDFSQVGIMGHSRGGEGARAAYTQYRDSGSIWPGRIVTPVTFRGIFEIGPVDGQTSRVLNATSTKWAVLLPMCDGDVSDLEGVLPFDRMIAVFNEGTPTFKATYNVWGANHNYYNTEWQQSDSGGCLAHRAMFTSGTGITGSPEQRQTGFYAMLAFFTANVGTATSPGLNKLFDPKTVILPEPPVYRGYTPGANTSQSRQLEDFTGATGTSTFGQPNLASNITINHEQVSEHASSLRAANISWSSSGSNTYFQSNWAASGSGFNLSAYQSLDLRIDRILDASLNPEQSSTFQIALVTSNNTLSTALRPDQYGAFIDGPVGGPYSNYHNMMQTIRIPLADFGVSLTSIRGVRLIFSLTASGHIYVANIRAGTVTTPPGPLAPTAVAASTGAAPATAAGPTAFAAPDPASRNAAPLAGPQLVSTGSSVTSLRTAADGSIEVAISSQVPFAAGGALLTLRIGAVESTLSRFTTADARSAVFTLPRADFDRIGAADAVSVRYGKGASRVVWSLGTLDKSRLDH